MAGSSIAELKERIKAAERQAKAATGRRRTAETMAADTRRRQSSRQQANLARGELSKASTQLEAAIKAAERVAGTNNVGGLARQVAVAE